MEITAWILIILLSVSMLVLITLSIVLVVNLIKLTRTAKHVVATGQNVVAKADDIADNVKQMTSVAGVVKTFFRHYTNSKGNRKD